MEQLAAFVDTAQPPSRAQTLLKTMIMVFDDILSHAADERHRSVFRDEIPGLGAKVLESCGFADEGDGMLKLPPQASLSPLSKAREEVGKLLAKARMAPAPAASTPSAGTSETAPALAVAASVALALQQAAASVSPLAALPAVVGANSDDVLSAAPSSMLPKVRGMGPNPAERKPRTATVPASVSSAAAALGQAARAPGGVFAGLGAGTIRSRPGARVGGASTWTAAPDGALPESRLVVELPEAEFTYIDRPWSHFVSRWAALDLELERRFGAAPFSIVDLGSCCGFFSLQAAAGYPEALVVGVEGSVGIGNGTTGVGGNEDQIIATKAVQTHLRWIEKLNLPNCFLTPEVWDYARICQLAALGRPISDVMFSLSVVHHIDNISVQQYTLARMSHLNGTLALMCKLLELAPRHFIELPDNPWLEHVYSAFGTARAFLEAVAKASGRQWSFTGPLCVSEWYGVREVWLLEDMGQERAALPWQGLRALFPRILGPPVAASPAMQASAGGGDGPQRFQQGQHAAVEPPQPLAAPHPSLPAYLPPFAASGPAEQANAGDEDSLQPPQQGQHAAVEPPQPPGANPPALTSAELGSALLAAPTALIAAHVQLRDALAAANGMVQFSRSLK